ncbi:DUF5011 domain-containing protein [Gynuella sunshinyii]|uniref:Pesticidal crystal protein Cry22Aa Ig-like domain-containing protein n=1 Tax=Gynuella sunshinyii YC6258 TaxID=1445510 RepID=A0A0C5VD90_9GAMM|nr:DUF5011 domain-containing protein [Gynuella sunshinyii]AJQ92507.1 hypothetical Protein YC6258_00457 [Gynuella sunshinyii YC6258]
MNFNNHKYLQTIFCCALLAACNSESDSGKTNTAAAHSSQGPEIQLTGIENIQLLAGSDFVDPGAVAEDAEDGDLTSSISVDSNLDVSTTGKYGITYTVVDSDGHEATVTRTIIVAAEFDDNYHVSWESNFSLPKQDADGWSILIPSSNSRLIYISTTSGDDNTAKVYTPKDSVIGGDYRNPAGTVLAYKTMEAAFEQLRAGKPDYLLFKRGDTFTKTPGFDLALKAGRSASERQVLTSYGPATERPVIDTGTGWGLNFNNAPYSAAVGLYVVASGRNPDQDGDGKEDRDFDWNSIGQALGFRGLDIVGHILIEDCWFDWYSSNYFQSTDDNSEVIDIIFRRNLVTNNYAAVSGQNTQGMYSDNVSSLIEENIFDHNGWYKQGTGSDDKEGQATYYNHNIYFVEPRNTIVRNNLFLRSSSIGTKFTSNTTSGDNQIKAWNLLVDNNLYLEGEVGIGLSGNKDQNNGPRFQQIYVTNNVLMNIGRTQPSKRDLGWGMDLADWKGGLVNGNIFAHWGQYNAQNNNNYAMYITGEMSNTEISNNIIYDIYSNQVLVNFTGYDEIVSFDFHHNEIQGKDANVQRPGRLLQYSVNKGTGNLANNYYYSEVEQDHWFSGQGSAYLTLDQYRSYSGDTTSMPQSRSYDEPERSISSYLSSLGYASGLNVDTEMAALIELLLAQQKGNWDTNISATAINNYIREGFCLEGNFSCR